MHANRQTSAIAYFLNNQLLLFVFARQKTHNEWLTMWLRIKVNPLTAGAAYIRVFIIYQHIKYHILNMLKIKCSINQQDLKRVDLHFVKSE